jgi:catechol 2,3-dioxygenase-like lactoylglutathione lyase family enzyme
MALGPVLVVGLDPAKIEGWDPEPIEAAIVRGQARFDAHGIEVDMCLVVVEENPEAVIAEALTRKDYACVVIGGGIRKHEPLLELFEKAVNLVRQHAPGAAIAFNDNPEDSADAALRWMPKVLDNARIETRIPTQDLARARRWYAEKLGLEPVEAREGGLRYEGAAGVFCLFASAGASDGSFTQMSFYVDDLEAAVADLRARGVVFEEYDGTVNGIMDIEGNYPSKGRGERAAWFRDSEGNLLGVGQVVR